MVLRVLIEDFFWIINAQSTLCGFLGWFQKVTKIVVRKWYEKCFANKIFTIIWIRKIAMTPWEFGNKHFRTRSRNLFLILNVKNTVLKIFSRENALICVLVIRRKRTPKESFFPCKIRIVWPNYDFGGTRKLTPYSMWCGKLCSKVE